VAMEAAVPHRGSFERGYTLSEVLVVLAIFALVLMFSLTHAIGWMGRVESRGAVYSVQSFLQRARMEAVSRNRACRFTVDTATGRMRVFDLVDAASNSDDILLSDTTLSSKISFARPDSGTAVTLASISGTTYGATFASDGSLSAGAGIVALLGGAGYLRVSLYGAGGTLVERWNGASWVAP
jgi:type IV fimbrial biogenesis protein FimT